MGHDEMRIIDVITARLRRGPAYAAKRLRRGLAEARLTTSARLRAVEAQRASARQAAEADA